MNRPVRRTLALAVTLALSTAAQAEIFRAYLASDGSDANPCTLPQPCRLLPAALAAVANEGEIWMLDSANYNTAPVAIAKSVTILAVPGVVGSLVSGQTGGALSISQASLVVVLRNLMIVPLPPGASGYALALTANSKVFLQDVLISGHSGYGAVNVTAGTVVVEGSTFKGNQTGFWISGNSRVSVTRSTFVDNDSYSAAIYNTTAGTTARLDLTDSLLQGNVTGVLSYAEGATVKSFATVTRCHISGSANGLGATAFSSGSATMNAYGNTISNTTTYGIASFNTGAKVLASGNIITDNNVGMHQEGGSTFETPQDNLVRNNTIGSEGVFSIIGKL